MSTTPDVHAIARGAGLHFGGQPIVWHRSTRAVLSVSVAMHVPDRPPAEPVHAGALQLHDPYEAECVEVPD